MLGQARQLNEMPIFDIEGSYLGKVEEVFLDQNTWEVVGIGTGDLLIARKAIKAITYKIVLNSCVNQELHAKQWTIAGERQQRIHELRMH